MATKANSESNRISQEAVARRAYELWEAEGRPHGRAMEHWTRAEAMLRENGVTPEATAAANATRPRKQPVARAAGRREKVFSPVL